MVVALAVVVVVAVIAVVAVIVVVAVEVVLGILVSVAFGQIFVEILPEGGQPGVGWLHRQMEGTHLVEGLKVLALVYDW